MLQGKRSFVLLFSRSALLFAAVLLLLLQMGVEAQCGTQASSCKSCHEVQAELPVNADGTGWHESHAFGDFCYICHAGNQQATELEAAHQGLVDPLSDLDASCKMCHAADLTERAQVYATTLNIELGSGSAPTEPTGEPAAEDFWGSEPSATTVPAAAGAADVAHRHRQVAKDIIHWPDIHNIRHRRGRLGRNRGAAENGHIIIDLEDIDIRRVEVAVDLGELGVDRLEARQCSTLQVGGDVAINRR